MIRSRGVLCGLCPRAQRGSPRTLTRQPCLPCEATEKGWGEIQIHGAYLGDVPRDGRVIEVLPLVEVGVALHGGGVGAALCPNALARSARRAHRASGRPWWLSAKTQQDACATRTS